MYLPLGCKRDPGVLKDVDEIYSDVYLVMDDRILLRKTDQINEGPRSHTSWTNMVSIRRPLMMMAVQPHLLDQTQANSSAKLHSNILYLPRKR